MKNRLHSVPDQIIRSGKNLSAAILTGLLLITCFVQKANAQTAAFTPSATEACSPTTIYFTDHSTGTVPATTYFWDFGNSNYSTLKNPSANYPQAGTYSVTLTLDKGLGTENSAYATIYVYPKPAPTVSALVTGCSPFSGSITAIATPVHVNAFTILGAYPAPAISYVGAIDGGAAVSYNWNFFGDLPTVNTGSNPAISLTNVPVGIYDVLLTVVDVHGCSKTTFIPNVLTVNQTPTASFTYIKQNLCSYGNVDFYGSALAGGTYEWKVDGSTVSTSQNFTYNFTGFGTYTVTYTVTSSEGCPSNTITQQVVFLAGNSNDFSFSGICKGQPTSFLDLSNTNVSGRTWDFGDPTSGSNTSTLLNPSHTFTTSGIYAVKLTKTFTDGCVIVNNKSVTIQGTTAAFSYGTPVTCSPITFTSTTVPYPGTTITGYSWNFNGTIVTGTATPIHSFSSPGTYPVSLTVTTSDGCTSSTTSSVVVTNGTTASFSNSTPVVTCKAIAFTSTTTANPGATITGYAWDFGNNGSIEATTAATTYTYSTPNTYPVKLTVTYSDGTNTCSSSTVSNIVVASGTTASFTNTSPVNTCAAATFTSTTTPYPGTSITAYAWNFGDPTSGTNTSTLSSPSHTYTSPGTYPVTLIVTTTDGVNFCTSSTVSNVVVTSGTNSDFSISAPPRYTCNALTFTSTTTPALGSSITGYSWNFGDPTSGTNTSTLSAPTHSYTNPGTYTVTLIETIFDGTNYCTSSKQYPVVVTDGTIADFTYPDPAYTCDLLTLTSTSSTYGGNTITLLEWDFDEDGITDVIGNTVTTTFTTNGSHYVTLKVTTSDGCIRTVTYDVYTTNLTIAGFDYSQPTTCSAMTFTSTSTTYTGATITNYDWNFNGTLVAGTATQTFSFAAPGTYSVTLTVTNSDGCTDHITHNVVVPSLSTVNFNISPANGCVPLTSNFSAIYSNGLDPVVGYSWDFGDPTSGTNTSTLSSPSHTYINEGTYTVTLTVTTNLGCTLTRTKTVSAGTPQEVISLVTTPGTYCLSSVAEFTATITPLVDHLVWNFGDGQSFTQVVSGQTTSTTTHSYTLPGSYTVSATAWYNGCSSGTYTSTLSIALINEPLASFTVTSPTVYCSIPTAAVVFNNTTIGADGVTTYLWNFGDGNTSTDKNPTHIYTTAGDYIVTLTATNTPTGCTSNATPVTIYITTSTPVFTVSDPVVCAATALTFTNQVAANSSANFALRVSPSPYLWNFGNSVTSTLANPSYTYPTPGTYTVTLQVTEERGCVYTYTLPAQVDVRGPIVNFTHSTPACKGAAVSFTDLTTKAPSDPATTNTYFWSFGDGSYSSDQNPTHTYAASGTYPVILQVTDDNIPGCVSSHTGSVVINPLAAGFTTTRNIYCVNNSVVFTNSSVGTIVQTEWDINGDGIYEISNSTLPQTGTYTSTGTYTIKQRVTSNQGCTDIYSKVITIVNGTAGISIADPDLGCAPATGQFHAIDNAVYVASYLWNFGDGTATSAERDPSHYFRRPGTYTVTLTEDLTGGCVRSATTTVSVRGAAAFFPMITPRHVLTIQKISLPKPLLGLIHLPGILGMVIL